VNPKTIISCAVTGGADTVGKSPWIPVRPEQIAAECESAADAGASIVHIHVRDVETGKSSMKLEYYRDVVRLLRERRVKALINLTTGPGARFMPGAEANTFDRSSNMRTAAERARHVVELVPDICSLDMGTLNFDPSTLVNVPRDIEAIAASVREKGVKPELEVFDLGHMMFSLDMIRRNLLDTPALFQFVLGAPWGAPATTQAMTLFSSLVPAGSTWAAFGVGRAEFPMVAQAVLLGGHVRVGLEDNLYISRGVLSEGNAPLVDKAARIIRDLGSEVATVDEARSILGLA
jgi:uncharacterized protein (DUF849 family)